MNAERMCRAATIFTLAAAFAALSLGAFAQVTPPGRINYQGVLRDASGNPFNGPVAMTFRFYDAASAGALLWEETYDPSHLPQVTVSSGLFTLALGDSGHLTAGSEALFPNVFALHATVYLAVKVGADAEMTPRIQVVAAPFALNADTLDGKHASSFIDASASGTFLDTSSTPQTKAGKLTLNGATDYGITAYGPTAGGFFHNSIGSGLAYVGYGDIGVRAYGNNAGGLFANLSSSGYSYLGYGDTGIDAFGNTMGGNFHGPASGYAYVGYGDTGIEADGDVAGGHFHRLGIYGGEAYAGTWNYGIEAYGPNAGGYFEAQNSSGRAYVANGDDGIEAYGNVEGGLFENLGSGTVGRVGYGTYSFYGTGSKAFVQNHPIQKDRVIVYTCPEGDEVAVYTRGSAKLVNGEAHVKLGETFQWVTNPDIGLTAHLTPKGDCNGLYTESVSTTEMVVKELNGGKSNAAFDYLVYGLRIGFEESSIVQEKQQEVLHPVLQKPPGALRQVSRTSRLQCPGAIQGYGILGSRRDPASLDMSRAKVLKDAIHEYDPATDPLVETLLGHAQKPPEGVQVPKAPSGSSPRAARAGSQTSVVSYENAANGAGESANGSNGSVVYSKPSSPLLPLFSNRRSGRCDRHGPFTARICTPLCRAC